MFEQLARTRIRSSCTLFEQSARIRIRSPRTDVRTSSHFPSGLQAFRTCAWVFKPFVLSLGFSNMLSVSSGFRTLSEQNSRTRIRSSRTCVRTCSNLSRVFVLCSKFANEFNQSSRTRVRGSRLLFERIRVFPRVSNCSHISSGLLPQISERVPNKMRELRFEIRGPLFEHARTFPRVFKLVIGV